MLACGLGFSGHAIIKGIYEWSLLACGGTHHAAMEILSGRARRPSIRWAVFTMPARQCRGFLPM